MTKKLSRILAAVFTVLFILQAAACSGNTQPQTTQSQPQAGTTQAENTTKDTPKEPKVTYEVMKNMSVPEYPSDGGEGKKLIIESAAKDGITDFDFNVTLISGQNYFDKLNVLASSNQLPDLFDMNLITLRKFADQGLLMDLTDYLSKMPNYLEKHPKEAESALMIGGRTYAFSQPRRPEPANGFNMNGLVIRKDWLDKLGLQVPDSLDTMYEVMKAFKTQDPDGNGKDDTYGLGLPKPATTGAVILGSIFGAFGFSPEAWVERDGKLVRGYTLPEMKSALEVLRKWYSEKLIDPDFLVTETKLANENMVNSKYGIYSTNAFFVDPYDTTHIALKNATPSAKIVMLEAPKGPEGKRGIYSGNVAAGIVGISAATKAPNRLIQYLDWTCDEGADGGYFLTNHGVLGTHISYDPQTNKITQISTDVDKYKFGLGNAVRWVSTVDRRWMSPEGLEAANAANKYIIDSKFYGAVPAEVDYPDIPKLYDDYFYKIMMGNLPVSAWDEFVEKYYAQGGKEIEKQVNEEYNKSLGK